MAKTKNSSEKHKIQAVTIHPAGHRIPPHPLAMLMPRRNEKDRDRLRESVQNHGQIHPGVTVECRLLDGNERQDICIKEEIPFKTVEFEGDDPLAFVIANQFENRAVRPCQRAVIAARLCNLEPGSNQHQKRGDAKLRDQSDAVTQEDAAKMLEISLRSVQMGKAVLDYSENLVMAVDCGIIPLALAAEAASNKALKKSDVEKAIRSDAPKASLENLLRIKSNKKVKAPKNLSTQEAIDIIEQIVFELKCEEKHLRRMVSEVTEIFLWKMNDMACVLEVLEILEERVIERLETLDQLSGFKDDDESFSENDADTHALVDIGQ